jgi:hypothetical protein
MLKSAQFLRRSLRNLFLVWQDRVEANLQKALSKSIAMEHSETITSLEAWADTEGIPGCTKNICIFNYLSIYVYNIATFLY